MTTTLTLIMLSFRGKKTLFVFKPRLLYASMITVVEINRVPDDIQ